jgi:DNA-binding NarL/FixJ family response regulator
MEPIHVMVVDDAADARFLITLVLGEVDDIEVVAEADGAERALQLLPGLDLDVALVDARMPAVDGYELTRRLLRERPALRVALLTSVVDAVVEAEATDAGAVGCWSKAELDRLADRIRAIAAG